MTTPSDYTPTHSITLPLTTEFTPPADCFKTWTVDFYDKSKLNHDFDHVQATSCYPSGFTWDLAIYLWSPGVCPHDYFTVSTSIQDSTTLAACCSRYKT